MDEAKLPAILHRVLDIEFIRFGIVGVIATAIHYGVYYVFQIFIDVNIAYSIGYVISWCCNFFLSSKYTFRSSANVRKGLGFAAAHFINYLLHIVFLNAFLYVGLSKTLAPIPVFCCVIPINYILTRTVFKSKWFQK